MPVDRRELPGAGDHARRAWQRPTRPRVRASSAPSPARWLAEAMAEDRGLPAIGSGNAASAARPPKSRLGAATMALTIGVSILGVGAHATVANARENGPPTGLALRGDGGAGRAAVLEADGFFPGRAVERTLAISNRSRAEFSVVTLSTKATTSSLLDSDPVDGLQLSIDACSVPWEKTGADAGASNICRGRTTAVVGRRPVIGQNTPLSGLSATEPGGRDYLRLTLSLPASADDRFQGQRSRISYSFRGAPRPRA